MTSRSSQDLASIVSFADALPVAIWVGRAPSGECVYVNREFERILGITPPEDAGRGNYSGPYGVYLSTGEPYPEERIPFEQVMRSKSKEVIDDIVIHRHDGTKSYLRVFASPILDDAGEVAYVVEAFTDITREVEAEQRRAEGERQLQAVKRLDSIGGLAGGIAHDFNNLLAIVKLVAGKLRANDTDLRRLEMIEQLEEVADSAAKLTRALLGFARRGKHVIAPIALHDVVGSVVELAQRTFERRIEVSVDLAAERDVVVGDATQLEQVVMNLVMNARDAIPGRGRIQVRSKSRTITQDEHPVLGAGHYIALEVEDTGRGIDPKVVDRLFDPYVTTKEAGALKGTGLGLATVYGIARAHGGAAEVARTSPQGTVMRVLLPVSEGSASRVQPDMRVEEVRGSGTILVVEDDPVVLGMMSDALQSLGYEVLRAARGTEAATIFQAQRGAIAGVVLDMVMPEMDGRETYLALRNIDPDVRVLLTTGCALNDEAQQVLGLGVRGFLAKPFDVGSLSHAIAAVLAGEEDLVATERA